MHHPQWWAANSPIDSPERWSGGVEGVDRGETLHKSPKLGGKGALPPPQQEGKQDNIPEYPKTQKKQRIVLNAPNWVGKG